MKVVIAPDSFKESLPANEVAEAIKRGFGEEPRGLRLHPGRV